MSRALFADQLVYTQSTKTKKNASNDNKQLLDEVFCDIQNNPGRGRGYQPRLITFTKADNPYQDLDYSGYHKNHTQTVTCSDQSPCVKLLQP